jgi:putative ABC transport system ATP-binding protein
MLKANLSTNLKTTPQQLLQALSIQNKQNQITQTLSLGEQQRVAIARALLQPFALLLADEPFSHLDPQTAAQAQNLIQQIAHQNHATILLLDLEAKPIFTPETTLHL